MSSFGDVEGDLDPNGLNLFLFLGGESVSSSDLEEKGLVNADGLLCIVGDIGLSLLTGNDPNLGEPLVGGLE